MGLRHYPSMLGVTLLAVLSLPAVLTSEAGSTAGPDIARGQALAGGECAGCHGADGNSEIPTFPKLAGQHVVYLLKELNDYNQAHRASDIMQPMAASLSEQDKLDIAHFYARQKPAPGTVAKPELLALGKQVYLEGNSKNGVPSCDGCHDEDGAGSGKFPRVAGQHPEYLLEELQRYASGKRSHGTRVMRTVAERLTPEEAEAVSQYMASLE